MVIPNLKFSEVEGGYSGVNFGHPKSEVFRSGGGYSGVNFGHPKSEVFPNGGEGGILVFNSRKGYSGKFGPKFTVQPETCLCITVVSHILRMWRLISPGVKGHRDIYFKIEKQNATCQIPRVPRESRGIFVFRQCYEKLQCCILREVQPGAERTTRSELPVLFLLGLDQTTTGYMGLTIKPPVATYDLEMSNIIRAPKSSSYNLHRVMLEPSLSHPSRSLHIYRSSLPQHSVS